MIRGLLCALLLTVPSSARESRPTPPVAPLVVIDPWVRDLLASVWDDTHPAQVERAYCVAYVVTHLDGAPVYRVWAIAPALAVIADPYHVSARCPAGASVAFLHVHTPTTCTTSALTSCVLGGSDAWECAPSETDRLELLRDGDAFALLQCDRHAILAYYPSSTP